MRGCLQQSFSFPEGFIDERKLGVFQVTEPPVDQTTGPTGRPVTEVRLIEYEHAEIVECCLARDGGAVDAGADDDQIEGFFLHNVISREK